MTPPPQHPPTRCFPAASGRKPDAHALLTTHSQRRLLDPNNSPDFDDCRPIVSTSTTRYTMPASLPTTIPSTPPTNVRRSALPIAERTDEILLAQIFRFHRFQHSDLDSQSALFRAFVSLILDAFRAWLVMSMAASLLATMFSPALDSGGAADWCRSAVGAGAADTVQPSVRKVQSLSRLAVREIVDILLDGFDNEQIGHRCSLRGGRPLGAVDQRCSWSRRAVSYRPGYLPVPGIALASLSSNVDDRNDATPNTSHIDNDNSAPLLSMLYPSPGSTAISQDTLVTVELGVEFSLWVLLDDSLLPQWYIHRSVPPRKGPQKYKETVADRRAVHTAPQCTMRPNVPLSIALQPSLLVALSKSTTAFSSPSDSRNILAEPSSCHTPNSFFRLDIDLYPYTTSTSKRDLSAFRLQDVALSSFASCLIDSRCGAEGWTRRMGEEDAGCGGRGGDIRRKISPAVVVETYPAVTLPVSLSSPYPPSAHAASSCDPRPRQSPQPMRGVVRGYDVREAGLAQDDDNARYAVDCRGGREAGGLWAGVATKVVRAGVEVWCETSAYDEVLPAHPSALAALPDAFHGAGVRAVFAIGNAPMSWEVGGSEAPGECAYAQSQTATWRIGAGEDGGDGGGVQMLRYDDRRRGNENSNTPPPDILLAQRLLRPDPLRFWKLDRMGTSAFAVIWGTRAHLDVASAGRDAKGGPRGGGDHQERVDDNGPDAAAAANAYRISLGRRYGWNLRRSRLGCSPHGYGCIDSGIDGAESQKVWEGRRAV
ncbi:hypothetical protein R3P38DRAFT_2797350 [Favolaschia claudopus]|uniref:Uncharacterized protein n=1 Tax=Favolaschia claudopus TaxID=2862362 RepID=A0AAW0A3T0_9AGAR